MKPKLLKILILFLAMPLARADAVLDWNAIATQTILAGGRPGASGIIDFAVVHAAIHDAVQAYENEFEPYAAVVPNASGSPAAAIAKATRDVLVNRFPAQEAGVQAAYLAYLSANGIGTSDPGLAVGESIAEQIIALRANDGAFPNPAPVFVGSNEIGLWRPTPSLLPGPPPAFSPMAAPWLADTTPFVVINREQFLAQSPPEIKTGLYTKDYNEVKALGALVGSIRTPEQTQLAYFWAGNFILQVNDLLRNLAATHLEASSDRARLFALVWLTAADGLITTWTGKTLYPTWRPVTAIREGDLDGNRHTAGDPNWQPLINTPNYPEHSSGANALISGVMEELRLFFGTDKMEFTMTTQNPNAIPNTRTYSRFSHAALEVVDARVYQGVHFRTADRYGRKLGLGIARYVFAHALEPLNTR